ncbi:MAG: hypothetical protein K8T91_09900 [Planctomycetes bacterium]|nr:hypothetical protein [Planctomycetota bacterium]
MKKAHARRGVSVQGGPIGAGRNWEAGVMHTVLENMDIGEPRGVSPQRSERVGEIGALSQLETPPGADAPGSPGNEEVDESVVFPDDHAIDDPALLEMRPARPQREIDLEALDYHLLGYSVRQIAKLQDVHPHTAFKRISRGREIDAKDPLRAEGVSLHAQADKLRQLERAFLPTAREGDFRSAQMILKIIDKLWRLGKFAREAEKARQRQEMIATGSPQMHPTGIGQVPTDRMVVEDEIKSPLANEEVPSWEYLAELLPDRAEEIAMLRKDFRAAEKAEDEEIERKLQERFGESRRVSSEPTRTGEPRGVSPRRSERVGESITSMQPETPPRADAPGSPGLFALPAVEPQFVRRPLTKKEKALHARAKRGQGADTARTERVQGANAGAYSGAYSGADANGVNHRENGVIAVGQAVA